MEQYTISARTSAGLVEEIELAVGEGRLAPGQRLPSVRALAAQAGLSPSTVAAALAELRRRGLVVTDGAPRDQRGHAGARRSGPARRR